MSRSGSSRRHPVALALAASVCIGLLAFGAAASAAPIGQRDTVEIELLITVNSKPGWDLVIPNFERVHPDIDVHVDYAQNNDSLYQLEITRLAAGNAPALLATSPGCGTPIALCALGKAGHLAPMLKKPWASNKRSPTLLTSYGKVGPSLVGFVPQVAPTGIYTNDSLFARLGLKVPQTYAQLLDVCRKAKAGGTSAIILAGPATSTSQLIIGLVVPMVYGKDRQWNGKLKAGKASFSSSSGWRRGLQRFVEMNQAGCFQPGATGVTSGATQAVLFAQGQGLMFYIGSNTKGLIDAANPRFEYSFHRFPGATTATETTTIISLLQAISVNAHASAREQAAAQTFVDFLARPQQNELFAKATGGLTQYQFLKGELPDELASFAKLFAEKKYVVNPPSEWWNGSVSRALQQNQVGLLTGQRSVDDILEAMDAAWKQGPT